MQIIEHFRQEIREGRLQDGDMLPSGREIAQQFGVSLATAAKVATGLQALGLVTPRPGAGTVVTAPAAARRPGPRRAGPDHPGVPHPGPAGGPGSGAGGRQGLGAAARRRAAWRRTADRGGPAPAGDRPGRGHGRRADVVVPGVLGRAGPGVAEAGPADRGDRRHQPASGEDWVSARPPTSAEAREFGIKRGSPVAVVHSRRFDADGNVIEYAELIARADTRILYRYDYGGG